MSKGLKPYMHKLIEEACDFDDLLNDGDTIDVRFVMDAGDSLSMIYRKAGANEVTVYQIDVTEEPEDAKVRTINFIGNNGMAALREFINQEVTE